jgi:hypothetical protein
LSRSLKNVLKKLALAYERLAEKYAKRLQLYENKAPERRKLKNQKSKSTCGYSGCRWKLLRPAHDPLREWNNASFPISILQLKKRLLIGHVFVIGRYL